MSKHHTVAAKDYEFTREVCVASDWILFLKRVRMRYPPERIPWIRFAMSIPTPSTNGLPRSTWSRLSEDQLLAQCEVDTYRASGPGGQKRNKTSSAVRLRHSTTGLIVIAEESRSQHENKAKALKRLWQGLFLHLRDPIPEGDRTAEAIGRHADLAAARALDAHLQLSARNPMFWPAAGVVLDVLATCEARVAETAALLLISTGNLIDFLQTDPKLWQEANRIRAVFGHKPLR
jgi:hypothetical protein